VEMVKGGRVESGGEMVGGRIPCAELIAEAVWRDAVAVAMRRAELNLESVAAPAGQMPVVIAPGWNAVLLHEAVGHGLEGDCIRRGTSVFAGLAGTRVAAPGVTVIDDGALSRRRGSLAFDDEGTPTGRTVLIEDGILTGFMQDRLNARLMGTRSTGNGRRQSHAHPPIPRMTTTFMPAGPDSPEELIEAAGNGIWIGTMSGGNVEPATGAFAFSAVEARMIENGRLGRPVKNVTLIGKGDEALLGVRRIGNDFAFDRGTGTCGKDAQCVPVGCGQPSLLIDGLTVGGTG
ncbi:MAG: metalloprotease TldD, partial [Alphaproteobacteria bacterium]|nr:metalloprotease TldD [Alphaproteobacteria bacterium]